MAFRLLGMAKTKAALEKARLQIEAAAGPAVEASGKVVAVQMAARAPRLTGHLASQIGIDTTTLGDGATAKVGSEVPYDRFVQRGTVYMGAQPYGTDAADASIPGVVAVQTAVYKAAVD